MISAELITTMIGSGTLDDPYRPDAPQGVNFAEGYVGNGLGNTLVIPVTVGDESELSGSVILWSSAFPADKIPDSLEIEAVSNKIAALTGTVPTAAQKAAVATMTRKQISDYIKDLVR